MPATELVGQGWLQIAELVFAFVLSMLIGLERETRQKAAGLRTYTLVGVASALFMLVSKYGFMDVISPYRVVLDPSRVAAQIVSGIGFIGGGVIFVRGDIVKGLTTAASVWLVAAVGMACGAGLPILATACTICYFITIFGLPIIFRALPRSRWAALPLTVCYEDGRGILREILVTCSRHGFSFSNVSVGRSDANSKGKDWQIGREGQTPHPSVTVAMQISGGKRFARLLEGLSAIDGVLSVKADAAEEEIENE